MYLFVEGEGGPVQSENGGIITGDCQYRSQAFRWQCSRNFLSYATPIVNSVTPRVAVPGQLITVYGSTGITDSWSRDEEDRSISFEPRNMEEWFNSDVEQRSTIGIKENLIRVRLGDYVCETSDERGRPYRSYSKRVKYYLSDRRSWFQCRIPDSMPAGTYPIFSSKRTTANQLWLQQATMYPGQMQALAMQSQCCRNRIKLKSKSYKYNNSKRHHNSTCKRGKLEQDWRQDFFGGKECTTVGTPRSKEVQCAKRYSHPQTYLGL